MTPSRTIQLIARLRRAETPGEVDVLALCEAYEALLVSRGRVPLTRAQIQRNYRKRKLGLDSIKDVS
jgi:hypothetical protein